MRGAGGEVKEGEWRKWRGDDDDEKEQQTLGDEIGIILLVMMGHERETEREKMMSKDGGDEKIRDAENKKRITSRTENRKDGKMKERNE